MKKIFMIMIMLLFGLSFTACNNDNLDAYKAEGKIAIEAYAQEQKNYFCNDSWTVVRRIVETSKQIIEESRNKACVDSAVEGAKAEIEEYKIMIEYNVKRLHAIIELGHFNEEFLRENKTLGVRYENENWKPGDDDEKYLYDKVSPEVRTFVVEEQTQLDQIFGDKFLTEINFDQEIIIVCMYTVKPNRIERIANIVIDGAVMEIDFKIEYKKTTNSSEPIPEQGLLVMKLDKLNITKVNFKLI